MSEHYIISERKGGVFSGWTHMNGSQPEQNLASNADARRKAFLAKLREVGTVKAACEALGIPQSTVGRWRMRNPVFGVEMDLAKEGK